MRFEQFIDFVYLSVIKMTGRGDAKIQFTSTAFETAMLSTGLVYMIYSISDILF